MHRAARLLIVMGYQTAAELATQTRYSPATRLRIAAALDAPAGDARDAACLTLVDHLKKRLWGSGKRPNERKILKRLATVADRLTAAAVKLAAGRWRRISAALRRGMATLKLGHAVLGMRRAQFARTHQRRPFRTSMRTH